MRLFESTSSAPDKKQGPPPFSNVQGDGSSRIAKTPFGDGNSGPTIDEANRGLTRDPDLMYIGRSFRNSED